MMPCRRSGSPYCPHAVGSVWRWVAGTALPSENAMSATNIPIQSRCGIAAGLGSRARTRAVASAALSANRQPI